jgi:hypothetical protein
MSTRKNFLYQQSLSMAAFGIVMISSLFTGSALAQDFKRPDGSVPLPMDWSDHHVIYTVGSTPEQASYLEGDPRFFVAMRLHGKALADEKAANGHPTLTKTFSREPLADPAWRSRPEPPPPEPPGRSPLRLVRAPSLLPDLKVDWSISLGPTAGVAAGQSPAKFSFDVNAAPSCTGDYVVFPVNASTGYNRANVTGTFSTTVPSADGGNVVLTVLPTGGTAVTLMLTSSTSANTGLSFQVFTTASSANATTEASNLAAAINRNLSATAVDRLIAIPSTNTVNVRALTPGTRVTVTATATVANLSFGTVNAGTNGTQANIVGLNNLYSGTTPTPFCTGKSFPTFTFSYASGTGPVPTSPVLSLDGTKIAYVENAAVSGLVLHVLTIGSGAEFGSCPNTGAVLPTCATAPVVPGITANSTATDFMVPLSVPTLGAAVTDTRSSPFVNYSTDTLYVGDDSGHLYAVTGVFNGTPALAGGKFPVTVSSGNFLNSPVVDVSGTGNIFLGDSLSKTYEYSSAGLLQGSSIPIGNGMQGGIWDGALVDSTNSKVYFTTNCSGTGGNSALSQIPFTSSGFGTVITSIDTNGEGCNSGPTPPAAQPQYGATADNLYYTAGITGSSTASNGHILVSYQGTGSIRLAEWGFVSGALQTTRLFDSNFYVGASVGSSPSTEFYGSSVAYTPSQLTQSLTQVTVTTSASNAFVTGQVVTIAGITAGSGGCMGPARTAINGEQTITRVSATVFTFTSAVSTTITANSCTLTGSSATGSTQDYIFFGSGQPAVYAFTLPMVDNQNPLYTNTTSVTGPGGNGAASATSGMIVDNDSNSGQASSIYFGTQATSTTQCGTTAAYCAVKLTQSGLQ